jgi:asparagine synthase (glutamine-hydrolysing)
MCGITGILAFSEEGKKFLSHTKDATSALARRGPDAGGIFFHNRVALGHRRLKIIDVSDSAAQPMSDAINRYTIVFNGEIFNYRELKKNLLAKGIKFKSESDTEVLLYLFICEKENKTLSASENSWQTKMLEKLDGEFAFAIYDKEEENLFLARDRFGIKPLYYFADKDKFIFASEIKALLKYNIPMDLDETSLQLYLHLNYIPSPYSIFKNVKKLGAGHFLKVNIGEMEGWKDGRMRFEIGKYYELHTPSISQYPNIPISQPRVLGALNYADAQKKLYHLVSNSVQSRMISDVPLGTFLSGGIDSSIISALAAKHTKHLQTFSIGYKDEKYFDETHYAKIVAKKIKSEHTVFCLTNDDLFANLHSVLDYIDEPFADSSALAVHILSMHTRKYVKVALSCDGADELFGGYNKHYAELNARRTGIIRTLLKSSPIVREVLKRAPKSRNTRVGNKIRQLQKFSEGIELTQKERYWRWAGFYSEKELKKLFTADYTNYYRRKNEILKYINDDFNSVFLTDVRLVLENDMLVKADRMSMANSLEVRVPFLDHKIVDFAFSLPRDFKIDERRRKKILRDAFKNDLPAEIFSRKKHGFEVPLLKWFRTELRAMITDDLLSEKLIKEQGLFNYTQIKKILHQLFSGSPDDSVARVWGLIVFQYWWKKYL